MKIYTRTGDDGSTGLFGGKRVQKDHRRVSAYGTVDELNSALGLALSFPGDDEVRDRCLEIQSRCFDLGADLATPDDSKTRVRRLNSDDVALLEGWIDEADEALPGLKNFILPGGTSRASAFHLARTICRRAERELVPMAREGLAGESCVRWLNRLSDLLFTWARLENLRAGVEDQPWVSSSRE